MGLVPVDGPVAVFDPRKDEELWRNWGWWRCLGLLGKEGAEQLMQQLGVSVLREAASGGEARWTSWTT